MWRERCGGDVAFDVSCSKSEAPIYIRTLDEKPDDRRLRSRAVAAEPTTRRPSRATIAGQKAKPTTNRRSLLSFGELSCAHQPQVHQRKRSPALVRSVRVARLHSGFALILPLTLGEAAALGSAGRPRRPV